MVRCVTGAIIILCHFLYINSSSAVTVGNKQASMLCQVVDKNISPINNKTKASALYRAGNKAFVKKHYHQAYEYFCKAHELGSKRAPVMLKKLQHRAKMLYENAYIFHASNPEKSLQMLKMVKGMVSPNNIYYRKARMLIERIESGNSAYRTDRAVENREEEEPSVATGGKKAKKLTSKEKRALENLVKKADSRTRDKKFIEAIELYKKAALLGSPCSPPIYLKLGSCYASLGKMKMAYKYYKNHLKQCPGSGYSQQVKRIVKQYEDFHQ